jgi:RimJ/RimL family protein N-acetyltransferase
MIRYSARIDIADIVGRKQTRKSMDTQNPTLGTQHLSLVPLRPADAEILYRIYQVEGVLRYFPSPTPPPLEKVQRFVSGQQAHWEKYGYGNWCILITLLHGVSSKSAA